MCAHCAEETSKRAILGQTFYHSIEHCKLTVPRVNESKDTNRSDGLLGCCVDLNRLDADETLVRGRKGFLSHEYLTRLHETMAYGTWWPVGRPTSDLRSRGVPAGHRCVVTLGK